MKMTVWIVVLAFLITQLRNIRVKMSLSQKQFRKHTQWHLTTFWMYRFADIKNMQNISRIKSLKLDIQLFQGIATSLQK